MALSKGTQDFKNYVCSFLNYGLLCNGLFTPPCLNYFLVSGFFLDALQTNDPGWLQSTLYSTAQYYGIMHLQDYAKVLRTLSKKRRLSAVIPGIGFINE